MKGLECFLKDISSVYCTSIGLTTTSRPRCLKITEKVSFNVYILIKNAKNVLFWRVFKNLKLAVIQCYQTGQKMVENAKIQKYQMRHFRIFC